MKQVKPRFIKALPPTLADVCISIQSRQGAGTLYDKHGEQLSRWLFFPWQVSHIQLLYRVGFTITDFFSACWMSPLSPVTRETGLHFFLKRTMLNTPTFSVLSFRGSTGHIFYHFAVPEVAIPHGGLLSERPTWELPQTGGRENPAFHARKMSFESNSLPKLFLYFVSAITKKSN